MAIDETILADIHAIARYQAAEFRGDMLRLGMAAMMGNEAAAEAIAQASADAIIEHALDPDAPGVAERYRATCEATILSCLVKPVGRDADLPAVGSLAWMSQCSGLDVDPT